MRRRLQKWEKRKKIIRERGEKVLAVGVQAIGILVPRAVHRCMDDFALIVWVSMLFLNAIAAIGRLETSKWLCQCMRVTWAKVKRYSTTSHGLRHIHLGQMCECVVCEWTRIIIYGNSEWDKEQNINKKKTTASSNRTIVIIQERQREKERI